VTRAVIVAFAVAATMTMAAGCDSSGDTGSEATSTQLEATPADSVADPSAGAANGSAVPSSPDESGSESPGTSATSAPATALENATATDDAGEATTPIAGSAGDDAAAEPQGLGPLGSTEIEIDTGSGTVQIGDGDVPDVVPLEFPLPRDLDVQIASDLGDQVGFSGVSQLGFDELVALYRTGLSTGPFEVVAERIVNDTVAVFTFDGDAGEGEVAISGAPGGGHSVLVTFET
jgi:hypothetical protein